MKKNIHACAPKQLSIPQLKALKMQKAKLDFYNRLLLTVNKRAAGAQIQSKINNSAGSSFNQNIVYNFSKSSSPYYNSYLKNNNLNDNNILKYSFINNSARAGIIKFVLKIINSIFNSLNCIIAKPQFINKHDKLIIRIPFYSNNIQKDPLFSNINSNNIFNLLTTREALSEQNKIINVNNTSARAAHKSINLTKNVWIKWLKDYFRLNIDSGANNNKVIDLKTINNYIKNDKIIENKFDASSNLFIKPAPHAQLKTKSLKKSSLRIQNKINKYSNVLNSSKRKNQLLMRIANINNFDYLNTKRLNNLKKTSNKALMLKILKNLNYHNEIGTEILGAQARSLLHPVSKIMLDKIFGGVFDSKGYLGDLNFANEYKIISDKLLTTAPQALLENNALRAVNISKAYSKEIDSLNKISKNKLMVNLKLVRTINKNLTSLKSQFNENHQQSFNYILNTLRAMKQYARSTPALIFAPQAHSLINNQNNNKHLLKLLILNRQLSLIKKLGMKLLIKNNFQNTKAFERDYKKLILNIKILKLILNARAISNLNLNHKNDKILEARSAIKESFLAFESYNNKAKNNNNILKNNILKFRWLGVLLSKIFKKNVNIELIRLWNVGLDPAILSKIISKNSVRDKSSVIFKKLWRKIVINKINKLTSNRQNSILEDNKLVYEGINKLGFRNSNNEINTLIPYKSKGLNNTMSGKVVKLLNNDKSNLRLSQINDFIKDPNIYHSNPITLAKTVGISIKISGRLATERIQPKKTIKKIQVGNISKNKGSAIESYKFTNKNKRGAFTVSVRLASART